MNGIEVYMPLPETVAIEVATGVWVQFTSVGPKMLNVMVPVGLLPPESVAVSVMLLPTATLAEAVVDSVGTEMPPGIGSVIVMYASPGLTCESLVVSFTWQLVQTGSDVPGGVG
jgi:hypothetical protein